MAKKYEVQCYQSTDVFMYNQMIIEANSGAEAIIVA